MDKPLNSTALFAVLGSVRLRDWASEGSILAYIGENLQAPGAKPGDCVQFSYRDVAASTGLPLGKLSKVVRRMVAARVLELLAPGVGRRPPVYRLNPNVRAWDVPWRDPKTAPARVEDANEEEALPGVVRALRGARNPEIARAPWERAQSDSCARLQGARATETPRSPLEGARNGDSAFTSMGARANGEAAFTSKRRAQQRDDSPPYTSSSFSKSSLLEREDVSRVAAAIGERAGEPCWAPSLLVKIASLLDAGTSLDAAIAGVGRAPAGWLAPRIVGNLAALAGGAMPAPVTPPAPPSGPNPYAGYDDRSRWELPEVDLRRPPLLSELLGRQNGCQNGHRAEEET